MKSHDNVQDVIITSSIDNEQQPALFYLPKHGHEKIPLVVALHNWSNGYLHQHRQEYLRVCTELGLAMIFPHFRGPNVRPKACGSTFAVQDIIDATEYGIEHAPIDTNRVYLVGGSGGGYAALMAASKAPELWTAVSSWVPITDLKQWHEQSLVLGTKYAEDIEKACGGKPGSSPVVNNEYIVRSAITHLVNAKAVMIDLNAGIHDGHRNGSVPISHALHAFNALCDTNGYPEKKLSPDEIRSFVEHEAVPEHLVQEKEDDALYTKPVLFRRIAGPVRITIFEGGHEILFNTAINWLNSIQ